MRKRRVDRNVDMLKMDQQVSWKSEMINSSESVIEWEDKKSAINFWSSSSKHLHFYFFLNNNLQTHLNGPNTKYEKNLL